MLLNDLLIWFIYFIITVCIWHYATPKKVKKEVKKLIKTLVFLGVKPKKTKEKKPKKKKNFDEVLDGAIKKKRVELRGEIIMDEDEKEKELQAEIKKLREENKQLKQSKPKEKKEKKEFSIKDELKRQNEITKDLW